MKHTNTCRIAANFIQAFIDARSPRSLFCTSAEIMLVYQYFPPCQHCEIKPNQLSTLTGRLYGPIWEEHKEKSGLPGATQEDIIDVIAKS